MKARVKATGEIGIVANIDLLFGNKGYRYQSDEVEIIDSYADIDTAKDSDYWEKLKHQYAGMAMQGLMSRETLDTPDSLISHAIHYATALVEKLKEKEE
jgi:hypothetical protein